MVFISQKHDQFAYFSAQLGIRDWHDMDVLDFGGNVGNMLRDPTSTIDESRYWCIDVDAAALAVAATTHPRAHWLAYDRWCFYFNPHGVRGLPLPPVAARFDIICAYSVFTNTSRADMLELVAQLRGLLVPTGVLAFTFTDPYWCAWPGEYAGDNLQWRLERSRSFGHELDVEAIRRGVGGAPWFTLVNHDTLYVGHEDIPEIPAEQQSWYGAFHTAEHMQALYPEAIIRAPANGEMQHCCILGHEPGATPVLPPAAAAAHASR
jgi:SAM-dependent methyltransferase